MPRRIFLDDETMKKFFGIGCSVVPIVGGVPVTSAEATLQERPRIIPASNLSMFADVRGIVMDRQPYSMTVIFENGSGQRRTLVAQTFVTGLQYGRHDEILWNGGSVDIAGPRRMHWTMEGEILPGLAGDMLTVVEG